MNCKKILFFFVCLIAVLAVVGCSKNSKKKDRDVLFNEMEKQNIISKGYKEVDTVERCAWSLEWCECTKYYIYKDNNSNLIAISYETIIGGEYDYTITVFYDVARNDYNLETIDDPDCEYGYYKYQNGDITLLNKYDFNYPFKTYNVKVDGKKYIFE